MRIILSILFSIVFCFSSKGQYFNKSYMFPSSEIQRAWNVELIKSDTFLVFAANWNLSNTKIGYGVFKIDAFGDTVYKRSFIDSTINLFMGWSNSTNPTSDGGFITGGGIQSSTSFGYLVKYNRLGDTLWTKTFGDSTNFYTFRQAKETKDGGLIAVGNYAAVGQRSDGWVVKTDSVGNLEWQQTYTQTIGTLERFFSIDQTFDGGYIVGGYIRQFPNNTGTRNYDPQLYKLDSVGNVEWIYTYDTPKNNAPAYVIQTLDSNYVFSSGISDTSRPRTSGVSKVALFKVDQSGNLIWSKTYGSKDYDTDLLVVKELADSTLIAAGRQRFGIKMKGILVHTQSNGDSIFVETYENDPNGVGNDQVLWDVIPLHDGGFMACGEVIGDPPHVPSRQDAWVIRVDSNGCIQSNCLVGVDNKEEREENIALFPNPTNGWVNLETSSTLQSIEVYNLQGKKVQEINSKKRSWQLPRESGLYLMRLTTEDGEIISKKIIKNKR